MFPMIIYLLIPVLISFDLWTVFHCFCPCPETDKINLPIEENNTILKIEKLDRLYYAIVLNDHFMKNLLYSHSQLPFCFSSNESKADVSNPLGTILEDKLDLFREYFAKKKLLMLL